MIFFSDRKKIANAYEEWLRENPNIKDCPENLVAFMEIKGLLKDRKETDFYKNKNEVVEK